MRIVTHPEASQELEAAARWYEECQQGLGTDFLDSFEVTLHRISVEPERWRIVHGQNRKINFHRFPYAVVYSVKEDTIVLKAIMHLHRRPLYWSHRS